MADIGEDVIGSIVGRISEAKDANDNSANPYPNAYAKYKSGPKNKKQGRKPVRDWTLRGKNPLSIRVKVASEDRCTIGPTDEQSAMIILRPGRTLSSMGSIAYRRVRARRRDQTSASDEYGHP